MGKIKETLQNISRTRRVEREFASEAEERVIKKPFKAPQTISVNVNGFQEFP